MKFSSEEDAGTFVICHLPFVILICNWKKISFPRFLPITNQKLQMANGKLQMFQHLASTNSYNKYCVSLGNQCHQYSRGEHCSDTPGVPEEPAKQRTDCFTQSFT